MHDILQIDWNKKQSRCNSNRQFGSGQWRGLLWSRRKAFNMWNTLLRTAAATRRFVGCNNRLKEYCYKHWKQWLNLHYNSYNNSRLRSSVIAVFTSRIKSNKNLRLQNICQPCTHLSVALRVWCQCVESVIAVIVTICFDLNVLSCIFISFSSNEWNKIRQSEGDWEISLAAYDWYTISLNLSHLEWLAFLKNLRC